MQYINKTRHFMKYCYLTAKYIRNDACSCAYGCKMAVYCDLTKKLRQFDGCGCIHDCKAIKNDMQNYFKHFKKD